MNSQVRVIRTHKHALFPELQPATSAWHPTPCSGEPVSHEVGVEFVISTNMIKKVIHDRGLAHGLCGARWTKATERENWLVKGMKGEGEKEALQ